MILFNWRKVKLLADDSISNVLLIMHTIVWPYELPTTRQRKVNPYYGIDFSGHSFLINPEPILLQRNIPAVKRVEYISLASRRCYADFRITRDKTLDYRLVKGPIENELITVKTNRVVFNYE